MPTESPLAPASHSRDNVAAPGESLAPAAVRLVLRPALPLIALRKACSFPVLLGAFLVAGAIIGCRFNLPDPDMWTHIALGRDVLRTHTLPTVEFYSFTVQGNESLTFEWLGEVIIAAAARGGLTGAWALLAVLSSALILLLYGVAYQRCGNVKAAFVSTLLVLPLVAPFFTLRPQLLGYLFLLAELLLLEEFRRGGRKLLWILPPLMAVWVNTHGSFIFGLLLLALYFASGLIGFEVGGLRASRWTLAERLHLEGIALGSLLALAATPYGTRVAGYTLHVILNARLGMANITEYQPLGASGELLKIMLVLLLPFVFLHLILRPAYRVEELALFLVALCGAFMHSRLLILFALAFAPLLARVIARWAPPYDATQDRYGINVVVMFLLATALLRFMPSDRDLRDEVAAKYPQGALEFLRGHPVEGPMLNDYGWGGYLMWARGPEHKVFVDGRSQLYEDAGVFGDYLRMTALDRSTVSLIGKYNLQAFLIQRDSPLATLLAAQPGWQILYSDQVSTIVARKKQERQQK